MYKRQGKGLLWLGGVGGVLLIDPQQGTLIRSLRHDPERPTQSLSNNFVHHLYQAPGGLLWMATGAGLNRFDPGDGKLSTIFFGDPARNSINRIAPSRSGALWLASGGGLIRYDPIGGKTQFYDLDPMNRGGRSFLVAMLSLIHI